MLFGVRPCISYGLYIVCDFVDLYAIFAKLLAVATIANENNRAACLGIAQDSFIIYPALIFGVIKLGREIGMRGHLFSTYTASSFNNQSS